MKLKKVLICSSVLLFTFTAGVYAATDIKLFVNGKQPISIGVELIDGISYVPLRAVSELLGQKVSWDEDKREIRIGSENDTKAVGLSRSNPARVGTKVTFFVNSVVENYEGEFSINEVIRGDKASQLVEHTSNDLFIKELPTGQEYLLAKIAVKVTKTTISDAKVNINPIDFTLVSTEGREYDRAALFNTGLDPSIHASLYAGASQIGWVTLIVDKVDTNPLITFAREYDGTGGIWFKTSD